MSSTAACPVCHRRFGLTGKGRLRVHNVSGSKRVTCSGSGVSPARVLA